MLDDLLRDYYQTGNPESLQKIIFGMQPLVIRLLEQCVSDPAIRVRIWARTIQKVRLSKNHPETQFVLNRGKTSDATPGFVIAIALHYAYRWLVWDEHPDIMAD